MTWYYMPPTSAPATEASSSPSDSLASPPEPWCTLSGTPTQRPLSWPGWKRRTWIRRLSGLTCAPSTVERGVDAWISSLPGSPANRSRAQASGAVLTMTGGSGLPSGSAFVTWDRGSCSWRTSPSLFDTGCLTSSPTLPKTGGLRNGDCCPRPPLVPLTSANGSGSWPTPKAADGVNQSPTHGRGNPTLLGASSVWPTPTAHDQKGQGFDDTNLHNAASAWPTPTATDGEGNGFRSGERSTEPKLKGAALCWPTPTAGDTKASGGNPNTTGTHGTTLTDAACRLPGPLDETTETGGSTTSPKVDLNPRFVEALMGVPPNWLTPSTSVETGSFQRWLHTHSLSSLTVSESI